MKALFKFNREIDGKDYKKGEHELPDSLANHWYLKALVKSGDVNLALAAPLPGPSSPLKGEEKDFEGPDDEAEENFDGEHEALPEDNLVKAPKPLTNKERKALERAQRSQ